MTNERFVIDKYTLLDPLGNGASSVVMLADDLENEERVALKLFKGTRIQDLKTEISVYLNIPSHRNLLKCLDHSFKSEVKGTSKEVSYLVLELAQCDLFSLLEEKRSFPIQTAKNLLAELLEGLKMVHDSGFAHRDIKFENLFLGSDGALKIGDFGFACLKGDAQGRSFKGTKGYRAPEMLELASYDLVKADVFSCGVVFFICIFGRPPFFDSSSTDSFYKNLYTKNYEAFWSMHFRHSKIKELDDDVKQVIECTLAYNPDERPSIVTLLDYFKN